MRAFKVNGVAIPPPNAGFSIKFDDISSPNSGRTMDVTMHKEILGQKWSIELRWTCISEKISAAIFKNIKDNTYIELTHPNPLTGTDTTEVFYTGTPTFTHNSNSTNGVIFWDITLNFIEQ